MKLYTSITIAKNTPDKIFLLNNTNSLTHLLESLHLK